MWKIQVNKECLKQVARVPFHIQEKFEGIFLSKEEVKNPFASEELGARLEKLRGEKDCYAFKS